MLSSTLKIALLALLIVAPSVSAATQRLLDCTLDSTAIADCDVTAYAGRLAGYAIVGLLFGIFTLLTCPFYFSCRYCCNCCGGRSATMGCCCACGAKPAVYSTMDIVRPKVYVILVVALAVGSCAWGYFSTAQTTQGMHGLVTAVNNTPQLLLNQLNLINNALIIDQYDANTDTISRVNLFSGSSLQSQGEDLKKQMSDALSNNLGTVDTYIGYFSTTMNVLFAVPIVIVIVAALCAVCNIRTCIPMLSVALMFLMGFLMWTCHGIFNPLALVTGDLCAEIHGLTLNQKTILKPISQCNDTMFSEFLTSFTSIEQSVAGQACTKLQSLCYDNTQSTLTNIGNGRVYDCGSGFSCSNVRFGDVLKIMQSGMVVTASVSNLPGAVSNGYVCGTHTFNCTPVYCADECRVQSTGARSDVGKLTQQMYTTFLGAEQVSLALDTLGGQYGSCDALMQLVLNPFDSGCQDLSGGALSLRDATGLVGVTSFGFIFILAWGSKRFMSLPETEDTKEYEMSVPVPAKNPLAGYDSKPASPRSLQAVGPTEHSPKQMDEV